MTERHPDHERVKAALIKAWDGAETSYTSRFSAITDVAIHLGARRPDPRESLVTDLWAKFSDWRLKEDPRDSEEFARFVINYVLDNAPKEE